MTSREFTKEAKAAVQAECAANGREFSEAVFKSALEKARRHMRNKYGRTDYENEHAESGTDNVRYFYAETLRQPGRDTFNHDTAATRREVLRSEKEGV